MLIKQKVPSLHLIFPRQSIRLLPWLLKNEIFYLIVHVFLKKSVYCTLIYRKWVQNDKCFFKSSHNVLAPKTDVILHDVAAKICQFDVTSICINTVRSVLFIINHGLHVITGTNKDEVVSQIQKPWSRLKMPRFRQYFATQSNTKIGNSGYHWYFYRRGETKCRSAFKIRQNKRLRLNYFVSVHTNTFYAWQRWRFLWFWRICVIKRR